VSIDAHRTIEAIWRIESPKKASRTTLVLAELAPDEPEVHALAALMEIQASRTRARVAPSGEPILLLEQDRLQRSAR